MFRCIIIDNANFFNMPIGVTVSEWLSIAVEFTQHIHASSYRCISITRYVVQVVQVTQFISI